MPVVLLQSPTSAVSDATQQFLQAGLTGALCIIFGVVIVLLWRDGKEELHGLLSKLEDIQNKRVQEAQETQNKLMAVVERATGALATTAATMEQQREAMLEIRNSLKELSDEIRRS